MGRALRGLRRVEHAHRGKTATRGPGPGGRSHLPGKWGGRSALRGRRHGHRGTAADRHRGVRSRPRRRNRSGVPGTAGRRAGHRQVDAAASGRGLVRGQRRAGALLLGRGVRAPDQAAGRAPRRGAGAVLPARGNVPRTDARRGRAPATPVARRRFHPDDVLAEDAVGAGQRRADTRGGDEPAVHRQGPEHPDVPRRARHQGRCACGTEGARAHRGHRAVLRGRATPGTPDRPRRQEPVRRDQRARRVRDDRGRAPRRAEPFRALSRATSGRRAGFRGHVLRGRVAADPGGSPGAREHEQFRQRAPHRQRPGPESAGAAAGRLGEARRTGRGQRRRVREPRGRNHGGRAGGRPRGHRRRRVQLSKPPGTAWHGRVRGSRSRGRDSGRGPGAASPQGGSADGAATLRLAGRQLCTRRHARGVRFVEVRNVGAALDELLVW